MILDFDFETYCELDLTKVGTDVYSKHPSCEPVLLAYSIDEGPVRQWDLFEDGPEFPADFMDALEDPDCEAWAHNAAFERQILRNVCRIKVPVKRWRDTMILAHACSFPGKLEKLGPIIGMDDDKRKIARGKLLIRRFCTPRKPTKNKPWTRETPETSPSEWEEFKEYNRQDVVAQQEVRRRLRRFMPSKKWWRFWHLDQVINQRGMPVNRQMVKNAIRIYEEEIARLKAELIEITGLDNPNSGPQFLPWAKEHGYPFDDLKKGHVARGLEVAKQAMERDGASPEEYRRAKTLAAALERRAVMSQTSPKKYYALDRATGPDDRLRNTFQFFGAARTGRFAGRIFQPQNLPRPAGEYENKMPQLAKAIETLDADSLRVVFGDPITALKSAIRPAIQAPEGFVFADCDLSAIENRGIGWITGDNKILRVFERGRDPYLDFGSLMFKRSYEDVSAEYAAGNGYVRKVSKPGVLGCGYMLGAGEVRENKKTGEMEATGLLGYAWSMGIKLTPEESALSVKTFRDEYRDVVKFWHQITKVVKAVTRTGRPARIKWFHVDLYGPFLRIRLPSGRYLHYHRPRVMPWRTPWGEKRPSFTYMGLNDRSQWTRISTHGGKLLENITQAVALDLLLHGMMNAHRRGLDIRIHVHDQIVVQTPESQAEKNLAALRECMIDAPSWARGFPLDAAGFLSPVFTKD